MTGKVIGARRYLYETVPDLCPWDTVTDVEAALWGRFIEVSNAG